MERAFLLTNISTLRINSIALSSMAENRQLKPAPLYFMYVHQGLFFSMTFNAYQQTRHPKTTGDGRLQFADLDL